MKPVVTYAYHTQEELSDACAMWQARLGLSEWDVRAELMDRGDSGSSLDEGTDANICFTINRKTAHIQMRHPDAYANPLWPYDMEKTLVHELLHIHFEPLYELTKRNDRAETALEQPIEALAKAIVAMHRSNNP